jgi:hypothetical protein
MRFHPHYWSALLCLLGSAPLMRAAELPTTVQLDIVFPKNNTVYKPVYPFPVVFGLHNGSAAWSYVIKWSWEIVALDGEPSANNIIASGGYFPGVPGIEKPAPPPNKYLIIDPVDEIVNTTARKLFMRYSFAITDACNETTDDIPIDRKPNVSFNQLVFFSLDPEHGLTPNITATGPCATAVGAIGIQKEIPGFSGPCPILADGPQPVQTCALSIDEEVSDQVSARMLNHTECSAQTWPNITGPTSKCLPKTSGGLVLWDDAILFTSAFIAVFHTILLFL